MHLGYWKKNKANIRLKDVETNEVKNEEKSEPHAAKWYGFENEIWNEMRNIEREKHHEHIHTHTHTHVSVSERIWTTQKSISPTTATFL